VFRWASNWLAGCRRGALLPFCLAPGDGFAIVCAGPILGQGNHQPLLARTLQGELRAATDRLSARLCRPTLVDNLNQLSVERTRLVEESGKLQSVCLESLELRLAVRVRARDCVCVAASAIGGSGG